MKKNILILALLLSICTFYTVFPPSALSWGCCDGPGLCFPPNPVCVNCECVQCINDADCNDGNPCTTDYCQPGPWPFEWVTSCIHTPISCDDGNVCTNDSCYPSTGCVHTPVSCYDGNSCRTDNCDPVTGCAQGSVSCDDGNACTTDTCDPVKGCIHTPISCDDGNVCTTDSCDPTIGCIHTPITCNDGNACTRDSCNATGCIYECNATGPADPCCSDAACIGAHACEALLVSLTAGAADSFIAKGKTLQFIAMGTFSDNTTLDVTTVVTWSSSNEAVATISNVAGSNGLATAVAAGSTNITATLGTISGSTTLTVTSCFIATASFGTEMAEKISVLQGFRDTYLLRSDLGRRFVQAYYKHSPPVADFIAHREWLRAVVRTLLFPVVGFISLFI